MSLVPSLLQAVVHVDGEALVMHAGDKPYVVTPTGQVDLASRGLALEALNGIVNQLLPVELQRALDEFGAVQYELPARPEFPGERFTVVAARGGDDVWVEVRRRRIPDEDKVPDDFFTPLDEAAKAQPYPVYAQYGSPDLAPQTALEPDAFDVNDAVRGIEGFEVVDQHVEIPTAEQKWPTTAETALERTVEEVVPASEAVEDAPPLIAAAPPPPVAAVPVIPPTPMIVPPPVAVAPPPPIAVVVPPIAVAPPPVAVAPPPPIAVVAPPIAVAAPPIAVAAPLAPPMASVAPPPVTVEAPRALRPPEPAPPAPAPPPLAAPVPRPITEIPASTGALEPLHQPAVVLPMSRSPIRTGLTSPPSSPGITDPTAPGLDRLLRLSSARGASALYLSSESRASMRVDGELQPLDGEPILTSREVESLLLTLMPERCHEALRTGAAAEWVCDVEEVGRVRCMSFRDHRGAGGVFRLIPTRSVSADQLGLPRAVQALATEPEGLVLVAGPRSSGKRTLMAAFVDLINRTRRDHVITLESEINVVHERASSLISQREARGSDEMVAAARAALREDPDVLVIEDLRTADLVSVALDAAGSGHLVVAGFSAHTTTAAIDRILDLNGPERRRQVQLALADSLRGVVVQVLLKKNGGGRTAAREVLLNTPAVSRVIAEGKTPQLPMALEDGRRYGMMPLNDALVGLVQQGNVDGHEAYRYASDRPGLVAMLTHQGVDTSFVEKLA